MFYGNRFRNRARRRGGLARAARFEEPFEPPRRSNCTKVIGTPITRAGGPPAVPHRGVQGKTPPACAKFFNVCRGCVSFFVRVFSEARGRSGVVPRVRLERVKTSRDAMRIAGRLARRGRAPDASRIAIGDAKRASRGEGKRRLGVRSETEREIFFGGTPRDACCAMTSTNPANAPIPACVAGSRDAAMLGAHRRACRHRRRGEL